MTDQPGSPVEPIRYTGPAVDFTLPGAGLRPAVGVHSFQVLRANREQPDPATRGWTYNHQPYLCYWRGQFYLEYLSGPVGEHEDQSQTLLVTSPDGMNWLPSQVIFPPYPLENGLYSIMHQRMGFYISQTNRLFALAFYGPSCPYPWPPKWDGPNNGTGIGRVVREVLPGGSFGPIYFIRYNRRAGWDESNTAYPFFERSPDEDFIQGCRDLLADPLLTLQWWEEDRDPTFFPITGGKAFSFYHRPDGQVVGLWKFAKAAISPDGGRSWSPMVELPSFTMGGAKVWGQRTPDGRYALAYNPHHRLRYPLALALSQDGIVYDQMVSVWDDAPPQRYSGFCKDLGPQYTRGIEQTDNPLPGGSLWLTYSVNKEDIWVSQVPVPVRWQVEGPVHDLFEQFQPGTIVPGWNIRSGKWTPVTLVDLSEEHCRCLELRDRDPYDEACAMRIFAESQKAHLRLVLTPCQDEWGWLEITILDGRGVQALRLVLNDHAWLLASNDSLDTLVGRYEAGQRLSLDLVVDTLAGVYHLKIGEDSPTQVFALPGTVKSIERLRFRTGPYRPFTPNAPQFSSSPDLPHGGLPVREAVYRLHEVHIEPEPF